MGIESICKLCQSWMLDLFDLPGFKKCLSCGFTKKVTKDVMKITLDMYKMGRDKQYPNEWTKEIEDNAIDLLSRINRLLEEIQWEGKIEVSSGWRPAAINATIANAAKKSAHQTGKACDLLDNSQQDLANKLKSVPDLLRKYGLMMENPDNTKGQHTNWTHLDVVPRTDRPSRIFNP